MKRVFSKIQYSGCTPGQKCYDHNNMIDNTSSFSCKCTKTDGSCLYSSCKNCTQCRRRFEKVMEHFNGEAGGNVKEYLNVGIGNETTVNNTTINEYYETTVKDINTSTNITNTQENVKKITTSAISNNINKIKEMISAVNYLDLKASGDEISIKNINQSNTITSESVSTLISEIRTNVFNEIANELYNSIDNSINSIKNTKSYKDLMAIEGSKIGDITKQIGEFANIIGKSNVGFGNKYTENNLNKSVTDIKNHFKLDDSITIASNNALKDFVDNNLDQQNINEALKSDEAKNQLNLDLNSKVINVDGINQTNLVNYISNNVFTASVYSDISNKLLSDVTTSMQSLKSLDEKIESIDLRQEYVGDIAAAGNAVKDAFTGAGNFVSGVSSWIGIIGGVAVVGGGVFLYTTTSNPIIKTGLLFVIVFVICGMATMYIFGVEFSKLFSFPVILYVLGTSIVLTATLYFLIKYIQGWFFNKPVSVSGVSINPSDKSDDKSDDESDDKSDDESDDKSDDESDDKSGKLSGNGAYFNKSKNREFWKNKIIREI